MFTFFKCFTLWAKFTKFFEFTNKTILFIPSFENKFFSAQFSRLEKVY